MFATQFLLASHRPPPLRQGLVTLLLIILTGALLVFFTGLLDDRPWVLLPLLWLFYFACFAAQGRQAGGAGPALMLVIAIAVPMLDILQRDLGESIVLLLTKSLTFGLLLTWAAHALLPDPGGEFAVPAPLPAFETAVVLRQAKPCCHGGAYHRRLIAQPVGIGHERTHCVGVSSA